LGLITDAIVKQIETKVKEKFVEVNKKAFALGFSIGEKHAA